MITSYEEIARRAFEIWESEGKPKGLDRDHWLQAETELRQEQMKSQRGQKVSSRDPAMLKTPRR